MPGTLAYQHGIYPRSEELVAATRDLERGRTYEGRVVEVFTRERDGFVAEQRQAGLDLFSDGLLRWQDVFRPLVDASDGMSARALVRWFDNNAFYRAPDVPGSPRLGVRMPSLLEPDGLPEPRVATLPSPYLFSRAARTESDRNRLMVELSREVLGPVVATLATQGFAAIHLEEPWLPYFGIEDRAWTPFEEALSGLQDVSGDAALVLHTYFGDAAPHADRLRRLPVDAVGIDFVETDLDALPAPWGTGLLVGCLDGRRSILEPVEGTVEFVRRVAERLEPSVLYVSSNSDLELLGHEVARRKVARLGEVARGVKKAVA